jgi:hypothetical protein
MVKCIDCGFLAINRGDDILISAHSEIRQSRWDNIYDCLWGKYGYPTFLECAERVLDMREESKSSEDILSKLLAIIHGERYCQNYVQWRPGYGIKEHRDYKERQQFQDWQTRIEEQRMKFQEEQEKKADERYQEQLKLTRQIHKRELIYLGLCVTIAILLITMLGSAIEANWIPKWFGLVK